MDTPSTKDRSGIMARFAQSSAAMAVLYAGSTAASFLVGIILARLLGAAQYGVYALAMVTATLAGMVTEFGLPTLAMRETGRARATQNWSELRGLLHWADRSVLAISVIIALGFGGYFWFQDVAAKSAYISAMFWGGALIPVVAIGKLRSLVLLSLDHVYASQIPVMILRPIIFALGCLIIWWVSHHLTAPLVMAVQLASATFATLLTVTLYIRTRPAALTTAPKKFMIHLWLTTCIPMGLTEGLRLLQGQLSLLLVGHLAGTAAAGTYRVGDAVAQISAMMASVVATAATPMFARLHEEGDRHSIARVATLAAWAMLIGGLALGLPVALWGDTIFPLIFGHDFRASQAIFVALWIGVILSSLFGLVLTLANMVGQHRLATGTLAAIGTMNIAFGFWLIPQLGAYGAAIATSAANVLGMMGCSLALYRKSGLNVSLFGGTTYHIIRDKIHQNRR